MGDRTNGTAARAVYANAWTAGLRDDGPSKKTKKGPCGAPFLVRVGNP